MILLNQYFLIKAKIEFVKLIVLHKIEKNELIKQTFNSLQQRLPQRLLPTKNPCLFNKDKGFSTLVEVPSGFEPL